MNRAIQGMIILGWACLVTSPLSAAELKTPSAVPLSDMEKDLPRLVRIIEELGNGKIEVALDLIEAELPGPFKKSDGPFEADVREHWRQQFGKLALINLNFESVEVIGVRQVSSKARTLYAIANGKNGPVMFQFRTFRYQDQWKLNGFSFQAGWDQIEAIETFTRFEKPLSYDLQKQPVAQK